MPKVRKPPVTKAPPKGGRGGPGDVRLDLDVSCSGTRVIFTNDPDTGGNQPVTVLVTVIDQCEDPAGGAKTKLILSNPGQARVTKDVGDFLPLTLPFTVLPRGTITLDCRGRLVNPAVSCRYEIT